MAIEIDAVMQVISSVVIEATKAVVQAAMAKRGDVTIGHRSKEADMRTKLGRPSPSFIFTEKVKNIYKTYSVGQAEKCLFEKLTRQTSSHSGRTGSI